MMLIPTGQYYSADKAASFIWLSINTLSDISCREDATIKPIYQDGHAMYRLEDLLMFKGSDEHLKLLPLGMFFI